MLKKIRRKINKSFVVIQIKVLSLFSKRKAAERALEIFSIPWRRTRKQPYGIYLDAEQVAFDFQGTTVRGFRWSRAGARKATVLHGHESTVLNFEMYIKGLLAKGYEVIAVDAPAHGLSDGKSINALEYRDFIIQLHEKYGPIQSYIGHSFAGLTIPLAIEKIAHDESYRLALIAPATETTSTIDGFFKIIYSNDRRIKEEFEKLIVSIGGEPSSWYSVSRAVQNIKADIIWAHDEDDTITPLADAIKVKEKNYPNIKFVITKGLGHTQIYRDEKVIKAIIDFL
jgi:pimeloyl-ACP methyl ester carboxylesterase